MKQRHIKFAGCIVVTFAMVLLSSNRGYCEDNTTALMLQMTPVEGGTLNISTGVHVYDRDSEIKLSAVPKAGYQFVCWQGSVAEASSSSTSVVLDSPKIVIAVFERSKFETLDKTEEMQILSGGGGLVTSPSQGDTGLEDAEGGKRPGHFHLPGPPHHVPVPGKGDNGNGIPVPNGPPTDEVPEPATMAFLGTGIMLLSLFRKKQAKS
jgi:hypothetical protein